MKRSLWQAGALAAVALGAVTLSSAQVSAQATGRVRVVHMSPDAPAVDVLVDGQRAISNLAFKSAAEYAALPAGTRNIRVTPAGQNQTAVITADLPITAGQDATVVAIGPLAQVAGQVIPDNNAAPAAGKAKVRVVHAAPDAPAVDIAVRGGPVLVPNLAYRGVSPYLEVDAGTYNLEVRPTGTTNVALNVPNVTLTPGQIVTVFAAGRVADNSLAAVPVVYTAAQAAGAPRTGVGAAQFADEGTNALFIGGLALVAAILLVGGGALATQRRRDQ